MLIKLSDFILENSIDTDSTINDIAFEEALANVRVCNTLLEYCLKQMNMGNVFQEAAPAQQPPTVPTGQDLQQPSYSYSQDIDSDMPAGWNNPHMSGQNAYQPIDTSNLPSTQDYQNKQQQQEAQDKQIRQQERDNSMSKDTESRQMSSGEFAFVLITAIAGLIALITEYIKLLYTMLKRASQAADTNLNLIRIKRSLTVCKKYLDIVYPIAMGQQQLNDADFKAFVSEYNNMVNSIVNSMFESKDQTFTNNANGLLNSQEFKDIQRMVREIEANQSAVKSNLQKALQSGDQQSIQGMVVNTKRVNGYMSKLFTAARTDLQNAQSSYAQFNPNNTTTQTMTQPQTQTPPQTMPQPQTPPPTQQQQQGGQMMQMQ